MEKEGKPDAPPAPAPRCPRCGSRKAEIISLFGSQVMTMQVRCKKCGNYYEASKY